MPSTYQVQRLSNESIILIDLLPGYSVTRDMDHSAEAVRAILDAAQEPQCYVLDLTKLDCSFEDLMVGTSKGARGTTPLWHHPMLKKIVFVTQSDLLRAAIQGMNSQAFGHLGAGVFSSRDEALAFCRS